MKQLLSIMMPLFVIVLTAGCGDPKVTGKVTFPDGSPLAQGQVMFEKEGFVASGTIQKDGTYSAGKEKDGDGLPPGVYQVYLSGTAMYDSSEFGAGENAVIGSVPQFRTPTPIEVIAIKYMAPGTSGLTVEVKGKTVYDIKVEPPQ
jgi:hypothetical protein